MTNRERLQAWLDASAALLAENLPAAAETDDEVGDNQEEAA